jgi:hypothetical protein
MTTRLRSPVKRELDIAGEKYTLTIAPEGFKLVLKGKRKGTELPWDSLRPRSPHGSASHHTGT